MSTFHSDMEQNLGRLVCFCKIPMCFYREGKWTFSELGFIRLSQKKGQCLGSVPSSTCLYTQGAPSCPWRRCRSSLVAAEMFLRWVPPNPLPFALGKALRCDWGVLPNRREMLDAAKRESGRGRRKHMGCKPPPRKDCRACWSRSGTWEPASSEMTADGDKGRVAAGSKVVCFVGTPVNSHVVPEASKWLVPAPGRLIVGWHCGDVETQWDRRWRDMSQGWSGRCCLHSEDTVFSWGCCCNTNFRIAPLFWPGCRRVMSYSI